MSYHLRFSLVVATAFLAAEARGQDTTAGAGAPAATAPAPDGQAVAAPAPEETSAPPTPLRKGPRTLNGMVFQPTSVLSGPFTTTEFSSLTQLGSGNANAPTYNLQGQQTGNKDYPVAAFGQTIQLGLLLTPDISIRLSANALLFTGTNGLSLLISGVTAQTGFGAGVTAGKNIGKAMRLSFVGDVGLSPQFSALIGNAVLNAIQTGVFSQDGLFSEVRQLKGQPGLSFAWAPLQTLGFVAEVRYVWTRLVGNGEISQRITQGASVGGAIGFDLDPLIHFPLGLQASYRYDIPTGNRGIPEVQQGGLGFYYTRRVNLALGLEAQFRHGDIRPGVQPTLRADLGIGTVQFHYYW
jgi:hypothetical protein